MARYVDIECDSVTEVINRRAFKSRDDIQDFLDNIPTADVHEVKHGEWLPDYETFTDCNGFESEPIQTGWVCSVCDRQESRKEPYCHCGALMNNDCEGEKGEK